MSKQSPEYVWVRSFAPTDREFVLSQAHRLTIGIPPWRDSDPMLAAVRGWLESSMAGHGDTASVFIAEDKSGKRLGFATVTRNEHFTGVPEAYLGELVVIEEAAHRGVGRALVEACTHWAREQGYNFLAVSTGAANSTARHFYSTLGFLEEDVRYVKPLDPAEGEEGTGLLSDMGA